MSGSKPQVGPRFVWLVLGQFASLAGLRSFQIATVWWMVSLKAQGGGRDIGLFMVAGALPALLFARPLGVAVDRFPTSRVLGLGAGAAAVAVGLSAWLLAASALSLPRALFLGFAVALCQAFLDPAFNKALQEVVPSAHTEAAVAVQSSVQPLANFGGAVFGAALIDRLGTAGVVGLAALAYLGSSLATRGIRVRGARAPGLPSADPWGLLRRAPLVRQVLLSFGLVNFFVTPLLVVLPLYTRRALGGSATLLGVLEGSVWIGLVLGTLLSRWVAPAAGALRLGGVCLIVLGGSLALPAMVVSPWACLGALLVAGVALGINNVKFMSLFQRQVPPASKGRFFALVQALVSFTFPISFFLFGLLGDVLPPGALFVLQSAGVTGLGSYILSLSRAGAEERFAGEVSGSYARG